VVSECGSKVAGPTDHCNYERLYSLRRDKRGSHERPHKPVLLLSILDLLDRGVIAGNRVPLSDELAGSFRRYFDVVRERDDQPTIQNSYFHLNGNFAGAPQILSNPPLRKEGASPAWCLRVLVV
jgi:hypothetical protein